MKRIALILIRCILVLPYWILRVNYYNKNKDKYSLQKRYNFVLKINQGILDSGRIEIVGFGQENLPEKQGYLLAPNHQGFCDPLAVFKTHPTVYKAVVKKELLKAPLIGRIIKMVDYMPIDRSDARSSVKTIKDVARELKSGINYLVFPEGTRSRNGNTPNEFKWGTFKMATSAKASIVPVAIIDSFKVFESNDIKKEKVYIKYLQPITYEEYQDMKTNELALLVETRVREGMKELLDIKNG